MTTEHGHLPGKLRLGCFWLLLASIVVGAVELGSALLLTRLGGAASATTGLEEEVSEPSPAAGTARLAARQPRRNALHPFLGYVRDLEHKVEGEPAVVSEEGAEWGFPRNHQKLFHRPADDQVVVGIFGGSVAGILANVGAPTLEKELAKIPRFAGKKIVVLGLAQGGYKQPQQLMTLNYFLALGAHLDVVINVDGYNDVSLPPVENRSKKVFPFFPRPWYWMLEGGGGGMRRELGELAHLEAVRAETAAKLERSPWRVSRTARLLHTLADRRRLARIAALEAELAQRDVGETLPYEVRGPRRDYASEDDFYRDLVTVWQRCSLQMAALCRGLGIEYYHVLQPNQYVPGSKPLSVDEKEKAWNEASAYKLPVELGYPLLVVAGAELRHRGIAFFDLSGAFSGHGETLYADDCCHYNRQGNVVLGEAIARAIAAEPTSR